VRRWPKGYVGHNHETIGSDILSVLESLRVPEQVLGMEMSERLRQLNSRGWYPIAMFLELLEAMDASVGRFGMIKIGRTLFKLSHEARVKEFARSARDLVFAMNDLYLRSNRGDRIGGWKVLSFEPGFAELEKTTPHNCAMEEGILTAALAAVGVRAYIEQRTCFRDGHDACRFAITSSNLGPRWG